MSFSSNIFANIFIRGRKLRPHVSLWANVDCHCWFQSHRHYHYSHH